jgi:hypothetical protein
MTLEAMLSGWTGPASATEQDKQDRTERMVREAIAAHGAFAGYSFRVYAKGSYPNNTNVRSDSDVDIAVHCQELIYWTEESPGAHGPSIPYTGLWTPSKVRAEVESALRAEFGDQVDASGNTAIAVCSSTARVDADVVPCFSYEHHFTGGGHRNGTRVFRKDGKSTENFPAQHLEKGREKGARTNARFKPAVRILKRVENSMVDEGVHVPVPSYFVECLAYNCPDGLFASSSWTTRIRDILAHIWDATQGETEPTEPERWLEVNECKYLFASGQSWTRRDAREFAKAAWNYLEYS